MGVWGNLYSDSLSKLDQVTDLKILANNLSEIDSGAICANPSLKKFELVLGPETSLQKLTKSHFHNCQNLEEVSIVGIYKNSSTSIEKGAFEDLTNLKNLNLANLEIPHLTHNFFKNLNSLTHLSVRKCGIEKLESGVFDDLKNIEEIAIFFNKFTTLPENLFKNNGKAKRVVLFSNNITDLTWDEFAGLDSVTDLLIGRNSVAHFDAGKIAKHMPQLRELNMELNPISCEEIEQFAKELTSKLNHTVKVTHMSDPSAPNSCIYQ
ncbi:leucine-rich repeat-containing protein 15 [Tribolium castaneum]|uniref:Leucine-rich repeat-containing protein 15-like Protein n=1 Tax=Tribolium castaneum TaxID=7070 RepID=D6WEP4_TRICA|nr:PREDICTED: leucine-rich repeat-containing protein 15 [Tribolium castaneum]EEZ99880.1 Leucine-rich repeat-containing protein 15-like Protein [Tribolium castaneum]|eukprot:XP_015833714.1 PREDICTED: leucine-rich repeat-containing protein 15 [Tribolium castaneum]